VSDSLPPIAAERLGDAERRFVENFGRYYEREGFAYPLGCVLGWLVISDTPCQRASEICERLGVTHAHVDRVAEQMVPAELLDREELDGGDYTLSMRDEAWHKAVEHTFCSWPQFHAVMQSGLDRIDDQPPGRMNRLRSMEDLFSYLSVELPTVMRRFEEKSRLA